MNAYLFSTLLTLTVFVFTVLSTGAILPLLHRKHAGQIILEIGPNWHKSKEGTPTMGGIAPIIAVILGGGVFLASSKAAGVSDAATPFLLTLLFALGNAGVGMVDDITKIAKKRNLGLTPWQKLMLQSALAAAYLVMLRLFGGVDTSLGLPFLNTGLDIGFLWYPLCFLMILWFVNCANLTDGIDGLASSVAAVVALGYLAFAFALSSFSLSLCSSCMLGAALGFLVYNRHPARIFMGDTGSLFFGALAIGSAFLSGSFLTILLLGIIYTLEGISVVLQVAVFKLAHGKRLFRMAPFHHHLEKCGWSERKITVAFSLITLLFGGLALWGFLSCRQ